MTSRTLTLATLREHKACESQCDEFKRRFGESVKITEELCASVADVFDFAWAARLLSPSAWADYERIRGHALADYERIRASAWADHGRTVASARADYARTVAAAWARAYINDKGE